MAGSRQNADGTQLAGRNRVDSDPAGLRDRLSQATGRLLATAAALTDSQARGPSLLPGWSRGHVLTHLARNADGLRNLLIWASTGVPTPQYPSWEARNEAIDAGSGRPASELAADVGTSAEAFRAAAGRLSDSAWQVTVRGMRGPEHPAWVALWRRLSEVEIHHVDLDAGYRPGDWPDRFVTDCLQMITYEFADGRPAPACLLRDSDTGRAYQIGPDGAGGAAEPRASVAGPGYQLLAWLTGRSAGAQLRAEPGGQLPVMPAW
jgi:maleylpyruvate isomerase